MPFPKILSRNGKIGVYILPKILYNNVGKGVLLVKLYIKSSVQPIQIELNVDVYFELADNIDSISAARKIKTISNDGKNIIDEQAYADYLAFIEEVVGIFENTGFEITSQNFSQCSVDSAYFTLALESQVAVNKVTHLIFVRFAQHLPTIDEDNLEWISKNRNKQLDRFSYTDQNNVKHRPKFKVKNILINDENFLDYDDAEAELEKRAVDWKNQI